jgi:hypothetical protein
MKFLYIQLVFFFLLVNFSASAQTRYCEEVFSQVDSTDNIVYSTNRIFWPFTTGLPPQGELTMTFYEPIGDTATARPLMIILHGGNFLPQPYNQSVMGSRYDSSIVELCRRYAKRGFVAAAISYRQGWNAISSDQDARTSTLLKAVYRAVQDVKGAVRFFKKDAATTNQFRVDPNNIGLMGLGSSGFISMAYATLNKYEEITLPKFLDGNTAEPYIDTLQMGNYEGFGGDPNYNMPNWPGYDSNISLAINAGGALGDSTWLEAGEVPMICFHVPGDPYAPYTEGMVLVPTTGGNVVYVSGPYQIAKRCNNPVFGDNNAIFRNPPFIDPITLSINQRNDGFEGLCPFFTNPPQQSGPWDWWDNDNAVALWGQDMVTSELITNPNMSRNYALAFIDTMMDYTVPRFVRIMGLENCPGTTGIQTALQPKWEIFPNPFKNDLQIQIPSAMLGATLQMKNNLGQTVASLNGLNSLGFNWNLPLIQAGFYTLEIQTEQGCFQKKVLRIE